MCEDDIIEGTHAMSGYGELPYTNTMGSIVLKYRMIHLTKLKPASIKMIKYVE